MKKNFVRATSALLAGLIFCNGSIAGFAAAADAPAEPDYREVYVDFLAAGFAAGDAIRSVKAISQDEIILDIEDYQTVETTPEWEEETRAFLDAYFLEAESDARTRGRAAEKMDVAKAKAEAVTYAVECAEWSVAQGRASDVSSESVYMFASHYLDRNDYYWNDGNPTYLLDGEKQSGENGMLAKWITSDDRAAYDTYFRQNNFVEFVRGFGHFVTGLKAVHDDAKIFYDTAMDTARAAKGIDFLSMALIEADVPVTGAGAVTDVANLVNNLKKTIAANPDRSLSEICEEYINDDNVLVGYAKDNRDRLITGAAATVGGMILAGATGGASVAIKAIQDIIIDFAVDIVLDFFQFVSWATLRYSYSGRYSNRLYDYLFSY